MSNNNNQRYGLRTRKTNPDYRDNFRRSNLDNNTLNRRRSSNNNQRTQVENEDKIYSEMLSNIYQPFKSDNNVLEFTPPQSTSFSRPGIKMMICGNVKLRIKYRDKELKITTKLFTRFRELANRIKLDDNNNCLSDIGTNIMMRNNDIRNLREEIFNRRQQLLHLQQRRRRRQEQQQQPNNILGEDEDEDEDGLSDSYTSRRQNFDLDEDEDEREELDELFAEQNRLELSISQGDNNEELNNNNDYEQETNDIDTVEDEHEVDIENGDDGLDENNIFYDGPADTISSLSSNSQHQDNDFFSYKETHWQFYIGDQRIPLDMTIYAAIHWYITADSKWDLDQQYEIELKYSSEPYVVDPNLPPKLDCKVIEKNKSTLELLKQLHWLYTNTIEDESYQSNLFLFKNMEELLNKKLKEPIAILTGIYPIWVYSVFHNYRFLVSGRNQFKLFKAQVFGIRMYNERDQDISGFSKKEFNMIKRMLPIWKDKEIQTRDKVFDWALKRLEKVTSLSNKLKIKFRGLGGVGLGVTRDFFTILSEEFFKKNKRMWINNNSVVCEGEFVQPYKSGLYPALIGDEGELNKHIEGDDDKEMDLNMSKIFLTLLLKDLNENIKYDYGIDEIEGLYEPLVRELKKFKSTDDWPDFYIPSPPAFNEINFEEEETGKTVAKYQNIFIEYFFNTGINRQINWYKLGFEHLFPFKYLKYLAPTPTEFTYFFCGKTKEDWTLNTLQKYVQKKNQSPINDKDYTMILRIMSNLDKKDRRKLLRFATGCTRLPIGGWEVLGLNLDAFPIEEAHYYPVGRTCHNCIIVPPNNEEAELKRKLIYAIYNQAEIDRD
ncbi:2980_t:CDS:2 [Entrophospora sp. SA101]|nr:2971_t:CDS:2 [Entrophospora sp. SA101]CAJ0858258.1 2973_t:CDS:2 [Entrophospora sp. SA101]CAJ0858292.1 2976_t:CDS:2 [Entrophospora sp. SA101]CAJ0858337.1 2980_t:CDS:2 [Entrophospora sp. SA101]